MTVMGDVVTEVEIQDHDGTRVCRPVGELDAFTVDAFREQLSALAVGDGLVIDLGSVPFMDSAGLGALIGGIRRIRDAGGDAVVVCQRSAVLRLLHTTRFDRMVTVVPDVPGAVEQLRSGTAPEQ